MKKICGSKCYLSPIGLEIAENLNLWRNDLKTALLVGDEGYMTIFPKNILQEIEHIQKNHQHVYSIHDIETDQPIGNIMLMNVDSVNRNAMIGILIGKKTHWGKGFGTEAVQLMLDFAFNGLNLHNVNLGTYSFNKRAIRAYEKVGFKKCGNRREARIIGDKKFDIIFMDILRTEFTSPVLMPLIEEIEEENKKYSL